MSLIHNERTKLTANYLNTAATGFFGAGVVAPLAAAVFGLAGPGSLISTLTLVLGILIFFRGKHWASHRGPVCSQGAQVVNDVQILAFIIVPLAALALGWGLAYWARHTSD